VADWPVCDRHGEPLALFCDMRLRLEVGLCRLCERATGRTRCLVRRGGGAYVSGTIDMRERRPDGWCARVWWIDPGDASATAHWVPFSQLVEVR
jgi:hypothetical protein